MSYRVEYKNDHGDWILKSRHKNLEYAEVNAEVIKQYEKRIVEEKNGRGDTVGDNSGK